MNIKKILLYIFILVIAVFAVFFMSEKLFSNSVSGSETSFTLFIVDANGNTTSYVYSTTEKILGTVLESDGIITGEQGPYGMYIKTVDGIEADYDKDGTYWALYIDDEYAPSGIDSTEIKDGASYTLKIEQ